VKSSTRRSDAIRTVGVENIRKVQYSDSDYKAGSTVHTEILIDFELLWVQVPKASNEREDRRRKIIEAR
jgi:hypothetical protein